MRLEFELSDGITVFAFHRPVLQDAIREGRVRDTEDVFTRFDRNGDGEISVSELRRGLDALGVSLSKAELNAMAQVRVCVFV